MADRSYQQFCGLARALDLLGGRWTLLIVRNLLLGPRRYGTLLEELPGITTNLLAARLRALADAGLVVRVDVDDAAAWALTPQGLLLEPIVMELARFGARGMTTPRRGERVDIGWAFLSLKRRYRGRGDVEVGVEVGVEVRVDVGDRVRTFTLTALPNYLRVQERPARAPTVVIAGGADVVRAVFFGGVPVAAARAGGLAVAGNDVNVDAFFAAFAPAPIAGTGGPDPAAVDAVDAEAAANAARAANAPATTSNRLRGARARRRRN